MPPNSAEVVMAAALAVIALASIAGSVAAIVAARELRQFFRAVEHLAGPAVNDVRQLVGAIRAEADALVGTSREIRTRIVHAADAAEARLADLDALLDVVQGEVEETALEFAATLKDVRAGTRLWQWARTLLAPAPKKRRRH